MPFLSSQSKLQPRLPGGIGERADAPVIDVSISVEHDLLDPLLFALLGDGGADLDRLVLLLLAAQGCLQGFVASRCEGQRLVTDVVDYLRVDVLRTSKHGQPRPLGRALHLGPNRHFPLESREFLPRCHGYVPAPVLPTLRRMRSSTYLMPLPLYGSGGRRPRTLAATWPRSSRSTPDSATRFFSTLASIPCGSGKSITWE